MKDIFLLDLDDTLLDFPRAERVNFFSALSSFGIAAGEEVYRRFHAINEGLWKALERGEISREKLKVERFGRLCGEFGYSVDVSALAAAYYAGFPAVCFPFAGAREFLDALHRRGRVYLVTNGGTDIQHRHVADAGFAPYLSGLFISEEMGCDKPSAEYAAAVASAIEGFSRERAVWLGDSLSSDALCAARMGVDFVLFAPRGIPEGYTGPAAETYGEALERMK